MKNSADLGGCYPPRPSASVDNTLLDLQNSCYPTRPHSIIANSNMATEALRTKFSTWRLGLRDKRNLKQFTKFTRKPQSHEY